jgi:hypothetical protein
MREASICLGRTSIRADFFLKRAAAIVLTEIFYMGQSAEVFICFGTKQFQASVITCDLILNLKAAYRS